MLDYDRRILFVWTFNNGHVKMCAQTFEKRAQFPLRWRLINLLARVTLSKIIYQTKLEALVIISAGNVMF